MLNQLSHWYAVVPLVVAALAMMSKRLDRWLDKLGIIIRMGLLWKTALLGKARILRKVLERWRRGNDPRDLWPMDMAHSLGVLLV